MRSFIHAWDVVEALCPQTNAATLPILRDVVSLAPLDLRPLASEAPQPVEQVFRALFDAPTVLEESRAEPWFVYALLDAARSPFLTTRLETSGLEHCCLYDLQQDAQLGLVAPWLVRLEEGTRFTRGALAHDPNALDPRKMLGDGIFLASPLPIEALRRKLKRYSRLADEHGVAQFFRLQEPGMLDALLCVFDDAQRAEFFAMAPRMVYPWPSLTLDLWDFVTVTAPEAGPGRGAPPPLLDATTRRALAIYVNDREARRLALAEIADPTERPAASWTFARLMNAGFAPPPRLVEAFRLLQRCPAEAQPAFWQRVESGQESLRPILLHFADHYQITGMFEDF